MLFTSTLLICGQRVSAQQSTLPSVGFLHTALPVQNAYLVASFADGLKSLGYVDGQNIHVEYRWAEGHYNLLSSLAQDLIRDGFSAIVAGGGNAPTVAAQKLTDTVPIVFLTSDDPVQAGLVKTLGRPGGNVTGIAFFNSSLVAKRLELVHQLLPRAQTIAFLLNPHSLQAAQESKEAEAASKALGLALKVLETSTIAEIDDNFAKAVELKADALLIAADPFLGSRRDQIGALADWVWL